MTKEEKEKILSLADHYACAKEHNGLEQECGSSLEDQDKTEAKELKARAALVEFLDTIDFATKAEAREVLIAYLEESKGG